MVRSGVNSGTLKEPGIEETLGSKYVQLFALVSGFQTSSLVSPKTTSYLEP